MLTQDRHPFNSLLLRNLGKPAERKQAMMVWQWHWLDHMQIICTSRQTDHHASTSSLYFFTGQVLFLMTNQQSQSPEGIKCLHNQNDIT